MENQGSVTFVIDIVGNAADALAYVTANPSRYGLILLDMLLPDTNGYDVLPQLRSKAANDVAIVMASANSQMALVQLCVRRGADAFMVKPLGCENVRHIWQFVKDLPEGSFRDELASARSSFSSAEPAVQHAVLTAIKQSDQRSVLVCAGSAPSPSAAADATNASRGERCITSEPIWSADGSPRSDEHAHTPPLAPHMSACIRNDSSSCSHLACSSPAPSCQGVTYRAIGEPAYPRRSALIAPPPDDPDGQQGVGANCAQQ